MVCTPCQPCAAVLPVSPASTNREIEPLAAYTSLAPSLASLENPPNMGHDSSISGVQILGASPSQTEVTNALIATPDGPASPSTWQWLFELRALPPEERLIKARVLQPTWAEAEIDPWAASKGEVQIAILDVAHAAIGAFPWREVLPRIQCPMLLITGDPSLARLSADRSLTPLTTGQPSATR